MGTIHQFTKFNRVIISCTTIAFALSTIPFHIHAAPQVGFNLNDIGFAVRIEKLIEKINRYKEKGDLIELKKMRNKK
jgi:hypothetical protein